MQLTVRDSSRLLQVSEKTIYRWIQEGPNKLPAQRVNGQYRLNRIELLEWATANRINVSVEIFKDSEQDEENGPSGGVRLADTLRGGGIHYGVGGADRASVLRSVVALMPVAEQVDRQFLYQVLLARETLSSTAIGDGIAIPHVRNPIVLHTPEPLITLCFLDQPVDFHALDGQPVHTLFTIVSPTIRKHLRLLSRLAFALRQPCFAGVIAQRESQADILQQAQAVDRLVDGQGI